MTKQFTQIIEAISANKNSNEENWVINELEDLVNFASEIGLTQEKDNNIEIVNETGNTVISLNWDETKVGYTVFKGS